MYKSKKGKKKILHHPQCSNQAPECLRDWMSHLRGRPMKGQGFKKAHQETSTLFFNISFILEFSITSLEPRSW